MTSVTPNLSVLLLYSSRFGHSRRIAEFIAQQLQNMACPCTVQNLQTETLKQPLSDYGACVIVSSIRYGHFHPAVAQFIKKHLAVLNQMVGVFVPVCLVARRAEKRQMSNNRYAQRLLAKTTWTPAITNITAGDLRYPRYNFFDRLMVRLIMTMMKGDTDTHREYEYTDWQQFQALAQEIHNHLHSRLYVATPNSQ